MPGLRQNKTTERHSPTQNRPRPRQLPLQSSVLRICQSYTRRTRGHLACRRNTRGDHHQMGELSQFYRSSPAKRRPPFRLRRRSRRRLCPHRICRSWLMMGRRKHTASVDYPSLMKRCKDNSFLDTLTDRCIPLYCTCMNTPLSVARQRIANILHTKYSLYFSEQCPGPLSPLHRKSSIIVL